MSGTLEKIGYKHGAIFKKTPWLRPTFLFAPLSSNLGLEYKSSCGESKIESF